MDYSLRIAAIVEGRQTVKQLTADVKLLRQEADRIAKLDIAGAFESPEAIRKLKEQRRISGEIVESVDKTIQLEKTSAEQTRKKLLHQIKLNSAIRLFERRQKQTFSTGARDLKQFAGAIEDIEGAFSFFRKEGDISGIKALSEELGRINEQQREATRQTGLQQVSIGKVSDFQAAINKFKAAGLNTSKAQAALDKFSELAGTKKVELSKTAEKLLQRRLRLLREESNELNKQAAIERQRNAARMRTFRGAASSALIGGGFPLLFGQGGATAIGGAAGGLAGGLMGGGMGFALSIVGSAIGQAIEENNKFNKSLEKLNESFNRTGEAGRLYARDIDQIAKALGDSKEEALEAAQAFAFLATPELTEQVAKIFGDNKALFQSFVGIKDKESLRAITDQIININSVIGEELAKEVALLEVEEARRKVLEAIVKLQFGDKPAVETEVIKKKTRRGTRSAGVRITPIVTENVLEELLGRGPRVEALLDSIFKKTEKGTTNLDSLLRRINNQVERTRGAFDRVDQSLTDVIDKNKDKLAFEKEYAELIMAGVLPAAAKQSIELKKQQKELDKQYDRQVKLLDVQILSLRTKISEGQAAGLTTEQLEKATAALKQLEQDRAALEGKKGTAAGSITEALLPKDDRQRVLEYIVKLQEQINNLNDPVRQIISLAETLGSSFSESFRGLVTGSMSAQQALANLFQRTADHFLDMAAQMIAAQIKMKILGIGLDFLGGGLGGGAGSVPSSAYGDFSIASPSFFSGGMISNYANGGRPPVGRPSIVGERGPELFVPRTAGTIVPNHALGGANVTVNVDASGSNVEGDGRQGKALGQAIGAAVQAELIKQKRPGGLLS
tara:strand:- start:545 stop:3082 length:2538 start_codon:yes stop_codon:yes gene_type:complete